MTVVVMLVDPEAETAVELPVLGFRADGDTVRRAPVNGLSQALPAGGGAGTGGPTSKHKTHFMLRKI